MSFMLEKMVAELRRIKESHRINLNLDDEIQRVFFAERAVEEDIESRVTEMK